MDYQNDNIENVYNEIKGIEQQIIESGGRMKGLADKEAQANANYEAKKNTLLIQLYAEESKENTKRTEAHRTAIYRSQYSQERLERGLAAAALKAERDYLDSLKAAMMGKQSRLRVLEAERNFRNV